MDTDTLVEENAKVAEQIEAIQNEKNLEIQLEKANRIAEKLLELDGALPDSCRIK